VCFDCVENYIDYIRVGVILTYNKEFLKIFTPAKLFLAMICGVVPGIVLGGFWWRISVLMCVEVLVTAVVLKLLLSRQPTIKKRLVATSVISSSLIFELTLIELMFFALFWKFNAFLLLLLLPPILTPLLLGYRVSKKIKVDGVVVTNDFSHYKSGLIGLQSGLAGLGIGSFFRNVDQKTALIIALACFTAVNCILSCGLLSFQRLFFLCKIEKLGVLVDGMFDMDGKKQETQKDVFA